MWRVAALGKKNLVPGDTPPPHRYGAGEPFRLGVEEELLIVDPVLHDLDWICPEVLERGRWTCGRAAAEFSAAVVELISPVCAHATEAVGCLAQLRRETGEAGATLLGAGMHPAAGFGEVQPTPGPRYLAIDETLRGLMRRTPHCGTHVHVGMPDEESALRAFNGLRRWIPLVQALGANSPWWHGVDSGLASARGSFLRSLPRSGIPRAFRDIEDYEATIASILAAGEIEDYTFLWWDMRLHPRLGTVEIRAVDSQASLADLEAIAALIHGLAIHEAVGGDGHGPSPEVLDETVFRAYRDGTRATLFFEGHVRPIREVAALAVATAAPYARERGFEDALGQVERILREGNGADRQRAARARGGMSAVLRGLVRETMGAPRSAAPATGAPLRVVA